MAGSAKRAKVARRARSQIAQTFAALTNEHITITELLQDPPPCLTRVRIFDVLRRVPHLNRDGSETVLRHAKVWPLTTIGDLTDAERKRVLLALPPRVKR